MKAESKTDGRKNNGGARPNSGAKAQNKVNGEVKERVTIRMYPTHIDKAIKAHGSVQKWIDSLT